MLQDSPWTVRLSVLTLAFTWGDRGCIVTAMSNTGLFVKLDPESFERLRQLSQAERRQPGDQAAILLRDALAVRLERDTEAPVAAAR